MTGSCKVFFFSAESSCESEGAASEFLLSLTRPRVDTCHSLNIVLTPECFTCGKPLCYDRRILETGLSARSWCKSY